MILYICFRFLFLLNRLILLLFYFNNLNRRWCFVHNFADSCLINHIYYLLRIFNFYFTFLFFFNWILLFRYIFINYCLIFQDFWDLPFRSIVFYSYFMNILSLRFFYFYFFGDFFYLFFWVVYLFNNFNWLNLLFLR